MIGRCDHAAAPCATCADQAEQGVLLSLQPDGMGVLELGGEQRLVALDLVAGVEVGARLLVHAGVVIAALPERD